MINGEGLRYDKVWVFIPAFNSAKTLEQTLKDLPSQIKNIVVVDDGSTDSTSKLATEKQINVIRHEKKKPDVGDDILRHFAVGVRDSKT